jgi:phage terminase Nu1 subunit (DNA packaging protein)
MLRRKSAMAIIGGQTGLSVLLGVSNATVFRWTLEGMPHTRKGLNFYYETSAVCKWLRGKNEKKYGHLLPILEKYNEKEGE